MQERKPTTLITLVVPFSSKGKMENPSSIWLSIFNSLGNYCMSWIPLQKGFLPHVKVKHQTTMTFMGSWSWTKSWKLHKPRIESKLLPLIATLHVLMKATRPKPGSPSCLNISLFYQRTTTHEAYSPFFRSSLMMNPQVREDTVVFTICSMEKRQH